MSNVNLFNMVLFPGLALMCLVIIYRVIEALSFMTGRALGKRKVYEDELQKLRAHFEFARMHNEVEKGKVGSTPVDPTMGS